MQVKITASIIDKEDPRIGNLLSDLNFSSKKRKREGDRKEKSEEDVNVLQGLLVPRVLVEKKGILVSLPLFVCLSIVPIEV